MGSPFEDEELNSKYYIRMQVRAAQAMADLGQLSEASVAVENVSA